MKNLIECSNCKSENPHYFLTCRNCGHYLRDRVYNIDLWSTVWHLMESPVKTFQKIIFAEHKNFLILLIFLAGLKFSFNGIIFRSALNLNGLLYNSFAISLSVGVVLFLAIFMLSVSGVYLLNNSLGIKNKLKDNFAIYTYANTIFVLGLILTTLEYALFGSYAFTFEYSPFLIKPAAAYIVTILEGIFLIFATLGSVLATLAQTKNMVYSIIIGVILILILSAGTYLIPVLII